MPPDSCLYKLIRADKPPHNKVLGPETRRWLLANIELNRRFHVNYLTHEEQRYQYLELNRISMEIISDEGRELNCRKNGDGIFNQSHSCATLLDMITKVERARARVFSTFLGQTIGGGVSASNVIGGGGGGPPTYSQDGDRE